MKVAILFLLFAVSFVSARVFNQNAQGSLSCCSPSQTFDPSTQVCCAGVVSNIPAGSSGECCGTSALPAGRTCCLRSDGVPRNSDRSFDSATSLCCDGVINSGTTRQCCGTGTYDPSVDLCCANTRIANGATQGRQCCVTSSFNPTTDTCCISNKIVNGVEVLDRFQVNAGALSGSNAAAPRDTCCGTTAYNTGRQVCCGTTLTTAAAADDANSYECCGSQGFNPNNRICCGGVLSSPSSGQTVSDLACCGSRTFPVATQQCCTQIEGEGANQVIRTGVVSSTLTCCGTVGFDSATQLCCGNSVRSSNNGANACCGTSTFAVSTQQCCGADGQNPRAIPSSQTCCGTTGYDPSRQSCCIDNNGNGVVGGNPSFTGCCNGQAYDVTVNSCPCGSRVISLGSDLTQNSNALAACCLDDQYDRYTDFCCVATREVNSTLTLVAPPRYFSGLPEVAGLSCCFNDTSKAYNPAYQVCCEYKKKKEGLRVKPVCGNACCQVNRKSKPRGYFTQFQVCCGGRPLDYSDQAGSNEGALACCGNRLYTTNFFGCCADDQNVFDPLTQLCCLPPVTA